MKVKTSITINENILTLIDSSNKFSHNRSKFIEAAVLYYLKNLEIEKRNIKDLNIINENYLDLNNQADDVLAYQELKFWKSGDLYRVYKGSKNDSKNYRVFVIVSRQVLIDSKFSTVVCAPIYSKYDGLSTQVLVGVNEGLKHESSIYCDELISLRKELLTDYIGSLEEEKILELNNCLRIALEIEDMT